MGSNPDSFSIPAGGVRVCPPRLILFPLVLGVLVLGAGQARGIDRSGLLAHRRELPQPDPQVPAPAADPDFAPVPLPAARPNLGRYRPKPPSSAVPTSVREHDDNEIGIEYSLNQAGRLYEAAGEIDRALRSYRAAMLENPSFLLPYYNLARLYRALGMDDQVREVWRQLLKVNADDRTANSELGLYHLNRQQYEQARPCFENLVRIDPRDGFSMHNLGVTYAQAEDADSAVHWFRRAVEAKAPLDYREVLSLAAFDRIRGSQAFRDFAIEVGAEAALTAGGAASTSILAADRRVIDERLLPIGEDLIGLAADQGEGLVYNVAIYNGAREMEGLLLEKPAAVEGLAPVIQRSDAVMIVYSSSPRADVHINDATILPLRQRAQAVGIEVEWFSRDGNPDQMPFTDDAGKTIPLGIVGILTLRAAPATAPPTEPAVDGAPDTAARPASG